MNHEETLTQAGHRLPPPPTPGGNYLPARTIGTLVYLSGVISADEHGVVTGRAGDTASVEEGYAAARLCALTQLAALRQHLGTLDAIQSIVSLNGYVNAVPGFPDAPKIVNGASDLLIAVFGEAGRHVRAAVGVAALPRNALVEIQMTVEIHPIDIKSVRMD